MDCDSFLLSNETQNNFNDLRNVENFFDFSVLNKDHELFSNKSKKVTSKIKIETPKNVWIKKFVCLGPKAFNSDVVIKILIN